MKMNWLEQLKPGDKVVVECGNWIRTASTITTVKRVTTARIVVVGRCDLFGKWRANDNYEGAYHKKNGQAVGKDADIINRLLKPCTPEIEAEFAEREKRKRLIENICSRGKKLEKLSTEQLETINEWLTND